MSVASEAIAKKRLPEPVTAVPGGRGHPVNATHPEHGQSHNTPHAPPDIGLYEWTARIECKKFELCSSYSVLIFLGDVPDDPEEWQVSPNYVGSHHALVGSSAAEQSGSCRKEADVVIEGFVHLNQAIVRHSGLHSLKPDGVVPYLTQSLHWRVLKVDGEPAKLNSLEVTVHATPLTFPPGTIFPVPGEPYRYDCITYGQEGGSRHVPEPFNDKESDLAGKTSLT